MSFGKQHERTSNLADASRLLVDANPRRKLLPLPDRFANVLGFVACLLESRLPPKSRTARVPQSKDTHMGNSIKAGSMLASETQKIVAGLESWVDAGIVTKLLFRKSREIGSKRRDVRFANGEM